MVNLIGQDTVVAFQKTAPHLPGVYRMFNDGGELLYVGKAKNLFNRIKNYTEFPRLSDRIKKMVTETRRMEIITTETENEALLLEQDFIKRLKPKYNILMRDDKSYPYLALSRENFPRVSKFRGDKSTRLRLFGPFPSGLAVNESIKIIQDIFKLRTCTDSYFKNRQRPCLLFQIKRCSAPCCGNISQEDYDKQVRAAIGFLKGRDDTLITELSSKMERASNNKEYENAIAFRDQISYLNQMLKKSPLQGIDKDTDIIALARENDAAVIEVLFSRSNLSAGNFSYYPEDVKGASDEEILTAFLEQFYAERDMPKQILSNVPNESATVPERGDKRSALDIVIANARAKLESLLIEGRGQEKHTKALAEILKIPEITRLDVFDNSHISGTAKIGVMIVASPKGFVKDAYRKYNITTTEKGDDFAMMEEVLTRRYTRAKEEKSFPSLIVLDGGMPQISRARLVLHRLELDLPILGIAKTEGHDKGDETLIFIPNANTIMPKIFKLPKGDPTLFYLERIRDEAHRFAITSHRNKRSNEAFHSKLDDIEGIGSAKKRALLNYFGSVKNIENASPAELRKVNGINDKLAQVIYGGFH